MIESTITKATRQKIVGGQQHWSRLIIDAALDPEFSKVETPEGRFYKHPTTGELYASVTTILRKTSRKEDGLKDWQRKMRDPEKRWQWIVDKTAAGGLAVDVAQRAIEEDWPIQRVTEHMMHAGAKRGTELHSMLERFFEDRTEGTGPYWESIRPFLDRITSKVLTEYHTHHPLLRYAGQLDGLGEVDWSPAVLDWKTSDKEKNEEWIWDYFLQVAAYAGAVRASRGVAVEQGYVVIAIPGRPAQVIHLFPERIRAHFREFQIRLRMFRERFR